MSRDVDLLDHLDRGALCRLDGKLIVVCHLESTLSRTGILSNVYSVQAADSSEQVWTNDVASSRLAVLTPNEVASYRQLITAAAEAIPVRSDAPFATYRTYAQLFGAAIALGLDRAGLQLNGDAPFAAIRLYAATRGLAIETDRLERTGSRGAIGWPVLRCCGITAHGPDEPPASVEEPSQHGAAS